MKKSSVNFKNLEGLVFEKLYVNNRCSNIGEKPIKWKCTCGCGKETIVSSGDLLSGHTRSCGCIKGGFTPSKKQLDEKKCCYCSTLFVPQRKSDKYCSINCREDYNKNKKFPSQTKDNQKIKMAQWRKDNPAKKILSNIKSRNNIDLDVEWIQERLNNGKCEVTNIPFSFPEYGCNAKGFNHFPWTPSIDKIDPSLGYCKSNCRMVVWAYNRAKGLWGDDIIIKLAEGVIHGNFKRNI